VTLEFAHRSFMIIRLSMVIFGMVVGMSISTNAETVTVMDKASTDGSFTVAQTSGMERRGERRDTRQDCRQANGAVGGDKRNCKQTGRQN
jgi:type IV secretory pathway VirB6-like protein